MPATGAMRSRKLQRLLNARWWDFNKGQALRLASGNVAGEPWTVEPTDVAEQVTPQQTSVTVGSGGDFTDLNSALRELANNHPRFLPDGGYATITLLSGFTLAEQVLIRGIDLGWIRIVAEDAEVSIDRSALSTGFPGGGRFPAFGVEHGRLPVIAALFRMDTSGTATDRDGVLAVHTGAAFIDGGGVMDAGGRGVFGTFACVVSARNGTFTGAGDDGARISEGVGTFYGVDCSNATDVGIRSTQGASVQATDATADGCSMGAHATNGAQLSVGAINATPSFDACGIAVLSRGASMLEADGALLTNATNLGALAQHGAWINARQTDATGSTNNGYEVESGSIIAANGSAGGTLSQTKNSLTAAGIIFQ